jgi:AcrR family transcriptional regulator
MNLESLKIRISVNSNLYLKDPESSVLGKNIIEQSINMIESGGFESFTFRKLGQAIESTEASVYRYFENKYKLLMYLTSWYWSWIEYKVIFNIANINSVEEQLIRAISILTSPVSEDLQFEHVNEIKLDRIIISESSKAYLIKEVDAENKLGAYQDYKRLVALFSDLILRINPQYPYPHMLSSTVIEGIHHQRYFAEHLPRLTDVEEGEDNIGNFYRDMVLKSIKI